VIAFILAFILACSPPVSAQRGVASWYRYNAGQAAAGPHLRALLGPDWRGHRVWVCTSVRCIVVKLTDWCQCYAGTATERIVDLDRRSFAALAAPSRGLVRVTVVLP
jgi:rare lipoprotein A (peptidoglycan hydrolase)